MKGRNNDAHQLQIELGISFYHGYTVAKYEGFADSLGISAAEFTRRLGSLLAPATEIRQTLGLPDSMHVLRGETGARGQSLEPLALDERSYGSPRGHGTLPGGAAQEDSPHKALTRAEKISATQRAVWAGLTRAERLQKALDRLLAIKHKTPKNKKAIATLRVRLAGEDDPKRTATQFIYNQRAKAKRLGLPLPALPGKELPGESPDERRKRRDREGHQRRRDEAKGKTIRSAAQKSGAKSWGGMTAAERSAEMKRRMTLARENKAKKKSAPTYVDAGAHTEIRQAPQEAASA